jgi:hypothetical protein
MRKSTLPIASLIFSENYNLLALIQYTGFSKPTASLSSAPYRKNRPYIAINQSYIVLIRIGWEIALIGDK